jgi:hypothetical protein
MILRLLATGIIVFAFGQQAVSQNDTTATGFQKRWYGRAKALAYVIGEDLWPIGVSIGVERKFHPHFSWVFDIAHFKWIIEREVRDYPDAEEYDEYAQRDGRNFLYGEFRYYPFREYNNRINHIYISAYSKLGIRHLRNDENFPLSEDFEPIQIKSKFADVGLNIGYALGTSVTVDINIGYAYRWEIKNQELYRTIGPSEFQYGVKDNRWVMGSRFTLAFVI